MRDVVVICTRNRPRDLQRCLRTVLSADVVPSLVLVVDSSDGEGAAQVLNGFPAPTEQTTLEYLRSEPGLTRQRNLALGHVKDRYDVIHFLDDDVSLDPRYFFHILDAFERNPDCAGVSGHVEGWWNRKGPRLADRIASLDSSRNGAVTRAGFSCIPRSGEGVTSVEWMSGCCMSFRASLVRNLSFDDTRTGYGLGEDVDFSMRAAAQGPLLHAAEARLLHHQSPVNRHSQRKIIRNAVSHRWALADAHLGRVTHGWVIYGTFCESLRFLSSFVRSKFSDRRQLEYATSALMGLADCLRFSISGR